jgi:hypothetical protein
MIIHSDRLGLQNVYNIVCMKKVKQGGDNKIPIIRGALPNNLEVDASLVNSRGSVIFSASTG